MAPREEKRLQGDSGDNVSGKLGITGKSKSDEASQ
jgi:hypothetical protein